MKQFSYHRERVEYWNKVLASFGLHISLGDCINETSPDRVLKLDPRRGMNGEHLTLTGQPRLVLASANEVCFFKDFLEGHGYSLEYERYDRVMVRAEVEIMWTIKAVRREE